MTTSDGGPAQALCTPSVNAGGQRAQYGLLARLRSPLAIMLVAILLATAFTKRVRSSNSPKATVLRVDAKPTVPLFRRVLRFARSNASSDMAVDRPRHPYRLPGEFESQQALLVSGDLAESYGDVFREIVRSTPDSMRVVALLQNERQRGAIQKTLRDDTPFDHLSLVLAPHQSQWMRDFAPMMLLPSGKDSPCLLETLETQDQLGRRLTGSMRYHTATRNIHVEGGNLLSNGLGLGITTTDMLRKNSRMSRTEVAQDLGAAYGLDQIVFLAPLVGESTGHVDMFATFSAPDTVVIGSYSHRTDRSNASILDRNAALLQKVQTSRGQLRVIRIPMPNNTDGKWRTYTNVLYANGVLLLPVYPGERQVEEQAVQVYEQLLPGWKIARIDASQLIMGNGALHCVAMNLASIGEPKTTNPRDHLPYSFR